jgi:RNA polymerase sigma factor (sigma-70 family)
MDGWSGDESHLVDRLRRGDPGVFEELVIAYQHRVFGVALRMLRDRTEGEETLTRLASDANAAERVERGELEAALHRAIAELPDERRLVVVLRDLEGLSYEEIAEALALPLNTVRSRLHRARMDLKEKLERFLP